MKTKFAVEVFNGVSLETELAEVTTAVRLPDQNETIPLEERVDTFLSYLKLIMLHGQAVKGFSWDVNNRNVIIIHHWAEGEREWREK